MRRIISFDVGIHNLAYCVLEKEGDDISIKGWDVIDICPRNECQFYLRTKRECGKPAAYHYVEKTDSDLQTDMYLCQAHSKVFLKNQPEFMTKLKAKKQTIQDMGITMVKELDKNPDLLDVDEVVIENQPCLKNPTMKTVQMLLYSYFLTRGIIDMERIKEIALMSARNKLTVYDGPKVECNVKSKYQKTKKLGIEYCRHMIKDDEENLLYLNNHQKKDDLCDAYLQGVYYLKK